LGGGLLAIDIFETADGFTVNEVNHTMEFRNSITTTGVNIPARMVDYVIETATRPQVPVPTVRRTLFSGIYSR
jgi:[lysine-biosynthesis-protein LysW]--L-2-aminoadipate ligase